MAPVDADSGTIRVEVVYAEPDRQRLVSLTLPAGTTAAGAVSAAGLERDFRDAELATRDLGVWGHPVARTHVLRDGDRVELYRPLQMDPREARRQLAAHGKTMGGHADDEST